jgi:hypothetical protein
MRFLVPHPQALKAVRSNDIPGNMSFIRLVIPDLIRNPAFFWIPAFAGMTGLA